MHTHTFRLKLESPVLHLSDVDDLIGKEVEVTVKERVAEDSDKGTFAALQRYIDEGHAKGIFPYGSIDDPEDWQRQLRKDEWERDIGR